MKFKLLAIVLLMSSFCAAQKKQFKFDFTSEKAPKGYIKIDPSSRYTNEKGYGYDLQPSSAGENKPFYFSVQVPDGNYKVTIRIGSKNKAGITTVRGESRRLFIENLPTKKGEVIEKTFIINKRNAKISENEYVKIKAREKKKLNWDDKLTLEFNGDDALVETITIEKVNNVPTIFLFGDSTVVDQDNEPWASWGQMITRFFDEHVCFANYAESGESANTFIAAGRLKKALTQMKAGDYIFVEFGHNDQKQKGPDKGPYTSYFNSLRTFVTEAKARGAHPVLVTPTQRRSFNEQGKIMDTHGEYPNAMKKLAREENVPLIDLNAMTRTLYETWGVEPSTKAFVHYPANTYPGQTQALADNTHFNPYGAYEISKCIIEGMKANKLDIIKYLRKDYRPFNPQKPDAIDSFHWNQSPFTEVEKPDGN
jgi:Lysophospholipase L1 and related esterases